MAWSFATNNAKRNALPTGNTRRFLGALIGLACLLPSTPAYAQDDTYEAFGFVRLGTGGQRIRTNDYLWQAHATVRAGIDLYPDDHLHVQAAVDLSGSLQPPPLILVPLPPGDWLFFNQFGGTTFSLSRAFVRYTNGPLYVKAGRDIVAQGQSMVFSPLDRYQGFTALVFDDERAAVWSATLGAQWGLGSDIGLRVVPRLPYGGNGARDESDYWVRAATVLWETDMAIYGARVRPVRQGALISNQVLFAQIDEADLATLGTGQQTVDLGPAIDLLNLPTTDVQWAVGAEFSRNLAGPLTLRGDLWLPLSGTYKNQPTVALSADLFGLGDIQAAMAYQFDATGGRDPRQYTMLRPLLEPSLWTQGRHNVGSFVAWTINPLHSLRAVVMANATDGSGLASTDWTFGLAENTQLRISGSGGWGRNLLDAFGLVPLQLTGVLKIYF